jgi:hypothetical protein
MRVVVFGVSGMQHRRSDRPGRDIDQRDRLDLLRDAVVQPRQDIQRSGVDLRQLARRAVRHFPEGEGRGVQPDAR